MSEIGPPEDQSDLWTAISAGATPRDAGARLGIPPKRVRYLCEKWARQGIYDYGVAVDLGWPTSDGPGGIA